MQPIAPGNERQLPTRRSGRQTIVVTSANSPDIRLVVEAMLPLLMRLNLTEQVAAEPADPLLRDDH